MSDKLIAHVDTLYDFEDMEDELKDHPDSFQAVYSKEYVEELQKENTNLKRVAKAIDEYVGVDDMDEDYRQLEKELKELLKTRNN